jgi:hypothetical protein
MPLSRLAWPFRHQPQERLGRRVSLGRQGGGLDHGLLNKRRLPLERDQIVARNRERELKQRYGEKNWDEDIRVSSANKQ